MWRGYCKYYKIGTCKKVCFPNHILASLASPEIFKKIPDIGDSHLIHVCSCNSGSVEMKMLLTFHIVGTSHSLKTVYFFEQGESCPFSHSRPPNKKLEPEVCKFYLMGVCDKGYHCRFMHMEYPCKRFHTTGDCFKVNCKFSHESANRQTEMIIKKVPSYFN